MEQQIVCFGCGTQINTGYANYYRYKQDLGLSTEDALDKAQIRTQCCRMTLAGSSQVAERVRAAGRPITEKNQRVVVDVANYPTFHVERKEKVRIKQATEEEDITELEEFSQATFTEYVNVVKPIPKETVIRPSAHKIKVEQQITIQPGSRTYARVGFESSGWNMAEPDEYPFEKHLDLEFSSSDVSYRISNYYPKSSYSTITIPKGTLLKDALEMFTDFILTPNEAMYKALMTKKFAFNQPNLMLHFLSIRQDMVPGIGRRYPSIEESLLGNTTMAKVEAVKGAPSIIRFIKPTITKAIEHSRLESAFGFLMMQDAVETTTVAKVSESSSEPFLASLKLANRTTIELPKDFTLHNEDRASSGTNALRALDQLIGMKVWSWEYYDPELLGREEAPVGISSRYLLIALIDPEDDTRGVLLQCRGDVTVTSNPKGQDKITKTF